MEAFYTLLQIAFLAILNCYHEELLKISSVDTSAAFLAKQFLQHEFISVHGSLSKVLGFLASCRRLKPEHKNASMCLA